MAGNVPEILAPSVQSESMPTVATPEPPLGAFSGAHVGAGLSKIGEELHGIGWQEYHRAAEAMAQEKETEFQAKALKLRDQYRNMYNMDAVEAHEKFGKALDDTRKQVEGTLRSKYGKVLFNNNSLRNQRFVQESMDAHFEQQNRVYQVTQFKNAQDQDTNMVAALAVDSSYNAENIETKIKGMQERAKKFADSHGMDSETAENFAANQTHKATDALFKVLLDKKSGREPSLIRSELEKYTKLGMVDPARQKDAQHALGGSETNAWVSKTMANFVRVDHLGNADPEGYVPYSEVVKATGELSKDDPNYEQKADALVKAWTRHDAAFQRAGAELEGDVVARSAVADESSLEWQKFERLYPLRATGPNGLAVKTETRGFQAERRAKINAKEASHDAFGATRRYLDLLSAEEVKEITPATVDQLMRTNYHGPGVNPEQMDSAKAIEFLKKLQTGKLDPVERKFNQIATQALSEAYKGNRSRVQAAMNTAHMILHDAYSASTKGGKPGLSEEDLREVLTKEFSKRHWWGDRAGESYQRRPKSAVQGKDGNWYVPTGQPGEFDRWPK